MTHICVFNTRLVSTHYTLNYATHGPADGCLYEGWNFNSGNYLFTIDTK